MSKKRYSDKEKNEVLKEYDNGEEVPVLSKKYNIPKQTIYSWIKKRKDLKSSVAENDTIKEKELEIIKLKKEIENLKDCIVTIISRDIK